MEQSILQNIYESQEFFEYMLRHGMNFFMATEKWISSFGLTLHSFWVLYHLFYAKAGLKQVELVQATTLSKQTISYLTDSLIKRGYAAYQRDGISKRIVVLTPEGEALIQQILKAAQQVGLYSMKNLSIAESEAFSRKQIIYIERAMYSLSKGAADRWESAGKAQPPQKDS